MTVIFLNHQNSTSIFNHSRYPRTVNNQSTLIYNYTYLSRYLVTINQYLMNLISHIVAKHSSIQLTY